MNKSLDDLFTHLFPFFGLYPPTEDSGKKAGLLILPRHIEFARRDTGLISAVHRSTASALQSSAFERVVGSTSAGPKNKSHAHRWFHSIDRSILESNLQY
jgi:hypothetical protein